MPSEPRGVCPSRSRCPSCRPSERRTHRSSQWGRRWTVPAIRLKHTPLRFPRRRCLSMPHGNVARSTFVFDGCGDYGGRRENVPQRVLRLSVAWKELLASLYRSEIASGPGDQELNSPAGCEDDLILNGPMIPGRGADRLQDVAFRNLHRYDESPCKPLQ